MAAKTKEFSIEYDPAKPVSTGLRKALADAMSAQGLSAYELSKRSGLSQSMIWKFLSGESALSLDSLDRVWRNVFSSDVRLVPAELAADVAPAETVQPPSGTRMDYTPPGTTPGRAWGITEDGDVWMGRLDDPAHEPEGAGRADDRPPDRKSGTTGR